VYRIIILTAAAAFCFADVPPSVMAEQDLEKRSELALQMADESITAAAKAYASASDMSAFVKYLGTVEELAELSLKSLQDTGKASEQEAKILQARRVKAAESHAPDEYIGRRGRVR
jgi:hypothetical protein